MYKIFIQKLKTSFQKLFTTVLQLLENGVFEWHVTKESSMFKINHKQLTKYLVMAEQ